MYTILASLGAGFLLSQVEALANDDRNATLQRRGNPIPQFDNYIMCFSSPPPANAGWPANRNPSGYVSNQDLCPQASRKPNVGCRCRGPGDLVECFEQTADQDLWDAELDPDLAYGQEDFYGWCMDDCYCGDEEEADRWQSYTPQQQADAQQDEIDELRGTDAGSDGDGFSEDSGDEGDSDTTSANPPPVNQNAFNTTGWQNGDTLDICGHYPCQIPSACHGTNCQCKVTGAKWEPSAGFIEYTSYCSMGVLSAGLHGKREEDVPCPCNTTYVSYKCCDKELDGMVWEAPEMKLGELVKQEL